MILHSRGKDAQGIVVKVCSSFVDVRSLWGAVLELLDVGGVVRARFALYIYTLSISLWVAIVVLGKF